MRKALERIGLVMLGAALALAGTRLLSVGSGEGGGGEGGAERDELRARRLQLAEERVRTDMRLALVGFFRLADFREFAQRGLEMTVFVPVSGSPDRGRVLSGASRGVQVPRVVIDPEARGEWAELGGRLDAMEEGVDPRVFEAFRDVRRFLAEHPLPGGADPAAAARSGWSGAAVVDRWVALNRTLASRVVAVLSQLDAGS
ncbi:MAG: hypothetical protein ACRELC_07230 [Gemmatimonadota bacterium]